jgi:hypothetical protein
VPVSATLCSFNLSGVQAKQLQLFKAPRTICAVGAAVFLLIDTRLLELIVSGASDPFRAAEFVITATFAGFLLWAALVLFTPGPIRLDLTSEYLRFTFGSGKLVVKRWDDAMLNVSVIDFTSIPWGKIGTPQPVPMYFAGVGTWRKFALTVEAGTAILREAKALGLSLTTGGTTGSLLEKEYGTLQTHIRGKAIAPQTRQDSFASS